MAHSSWLPEAHAKTANAFRESPAALPMPIARCLMTPDSTPRSAQPVEGDQGPARALFIGRLMRMKERADGMIDWSDDHRELVKGFVEPVAARYVGG
jgi:hypothetical protein